LSSWNAICQSIDAQEEDGINQGTEPTSKKKQKKRGPETYYTDRRSFLQSQKCRMTLLRLGLIPEHGHDRDVEMISLPPKGQYTRT
jgi:hypothetical protein